MIHGSVGRRSRLSRNIAGHGAAWAAALLLLASCGGSSVDSDPTSASTAASTATSEPTAANEDGAETTLPPSTPTDDTAGDDTAGGEGSTVTSDDAATSTNPSDAEEPGISGASLAALPCGGLSPVDASGTLTFAAGGRLFELLPSGDVVCISEVAVSDWSAGPRSMEWSPSGEAVRLGAGAIVSDAGVTRDEGSLLGVPVGWTWPTGQRFLTGDGSALAKETLDGRGGNEIGSIDSWTAVAYHPDGEHIAMAGSAAMRFEFDSGDGELEEFTASGLHITNNDGTEPATVVQGEDVEISDVVFSADGTRLTFIATHGDSASNSAMHHVHTVDLVASTKSVDDERWLTPAIEDPDLLAAEIESAAGFSYLTIDSADPNRVLVAEGECGGVITSELVDLRSGGYPTPIAPGLNTIPIGFVGRDSVAVLELDSSCDGSGTVWLVSLESGDRMEIARDVDAAAVRWTAPELNYSLRDVVIVGFA